MLRVFGLNKALQMKWSTRASFGFLTSAAMRLAICILVTAVLPGTPLRAEEIPSGPAPVMRVCDLLQDTAARSGKVLAVVGRFSFREYGRFMSEAACETADGAPVALEVVYDANTGPTPAAGSALDRTAVETQLNRVKVKTQLKQFRFGSEEYDRWAVVYARFEVQKHGDVKTDKEFKSTAGRLVCRSSSMVIPIVDSR